MKLSFLSQYLITVAWYQVSSCIEKPKEKEYYDDQSYFQEEKHGKGDHQDGL